MKRTILAALAVFAVLAGTATAGPGSISLNQTNPSYGDTVNFTYSANTSSPLFITVNCGDGVTSFVIVDAASTDFELSAENWAGQAADCEAHLHYYGNRGKVHFVAEVRFQLAGS